MDSLTDNTIQHQITVQKHTQHQTIQYLEIWYLHKILWGLKQILHPMQNVVIITTAAKIAHMFTFVLRPVSSTKCYFHATLFN